MYKEKLLDSFAAFKPDFDNEILQLMSSKTGEGKPFPPYVPLVGEEYDKHKILFYATAQNIAMYTPFWESYQNNMASLAKRLYHCRRCMREYPDGEMGFEDVDINPYQLGVIPALLGVFLYAKFGEFVTDLNKIHNYVAVSNYYKFSLRKQTGQNSNEKKSKGRDVNPNKLNEHAEKYWEINDCLVQKELNILKPRYIISFRGRHNKHLRDYLHKDKESDSNFLVNDPSWILRGGSGVLSAEGSWGKKASSVKDKKVRDLVETYKGCLKRKYSNKREAVGVYLLKYYNDWKLKHP